MSPLYGSPSKLRKLEASANNLILFALGIFCFTISSVYFNNGYIQLSIFKFEQTVFFILCGFLHGFIFFQMKQKEGISQSPIMLISYMFLFSGWYSVILFPTSGFGFIEWLIVLLVLFMNIKNPYANSIPFFLEFFGIGLFFIKQFIFFIFTENIYDQLILGNQTIQFLLVIIAASGIVLGLIQFFRIIKKCISDIKKAEFQSEDSSLDELKEKAGRFFKKLGNSILNLLKYFLALLRTLFSGPGFLIVLAIILITGGLVVLIVAFCTMNAIYHDILDFIQPILEKLMTTGENLIHPSVPYNLLQTICFFTVFIFSFINQIKINKQPAEKSCSNALSKNYSN